MNGTAYLLRATWMRHFVLAALCGITTINYIQRNSIGGVEKTLREDLGIEMWQTGAAMWAFFLAYALCQIPSGWLARRWTPRLTLPLYAIGWSLATAACALVSGAVSLVGMRLLLGALQAGIFPCATMILLVWYPAKRRALATAILNSFMMIGSALGNLLTGLLFAPVGWRGLFVLYALPGLVWAVWFAWWFRNRPSEHPAVNEAERELLADDQPALPNLVQHRQPDRDLSANENQAITTADESARGIANLLPQPVEPMPAATVPDIRAATPLLAIVLSVPLLLICLQQFCRAGANRFLDQWYVTYMQETFNVDNRIANFLAMGPQWAGVIGGVVGGWLSDTLLRATGSRRIGRQGVAISSLVVCCLCYAGAYLMPNAYAGAALTSLGAFIAMFAAPCAYALTMDMGGRNLSLVFGAMNMVGNFGAMAFLVLIPWLKASGGDWTLPVLVFAGMHLVAAFCWVLLNPEGMIGEPRTPPIVRREAKDES